MFHVTVRIQRVNTGEDVDEYSTTLPDQQSAELEFLARFMEIKVGRGSLSETFLRCCGVGLDIFIKEHATICARRQIQHFRDVLDAVDKGWKPVESHNG